jgi:hypothetical protein
LSLNGVIREAPGVMELDSSDENYHKQILPHLSRSFALSILQPAAPHCRYDRG